MKNLLLAALGGIVTTLCLNACDAPRAQQVEVVGPVTPVRRTELPDPFEDLGRSSGGHVWFERNKLTNQCFVLVFWEGAALMPADCPPAIPAEAFR